MLSLVRCPAPCGGELCVEVVRAHYCCMEVKGFWAATSLKRCVAQFHCHCEPRCHGNGGSCQNSYKSTDMLSVILPIMPFVT